LISRVTRSFRRSLENLPKDVRRQASATFRLWLADPWKRSLEFKRVHPQRLVYSVRVGLNWRALAVVEGDVARWFWIGPHSEYDRIVKNL